MDEAQFLKGIAESDIRPEWGPMLWKSRFLYPPLFQITRLVQAGAIDADTAADWARKDRYPPEVVSALHAYWSKSTTATGQTHTQKAQTQLWTATHTAYKNGDIDDVTAGENLTAAGVPQAEHAAILELWARESATPRKRLTAAQVKKAWVKANVNDATGQPWTQDEAVEYLVGLGYGVDDARSFLNIG